MKIIIILITIISLSSCSKSSTSGAVISASAQIGTWSNSYVSNGQNVTKVYYKWQVTFSDLIADSTNIYVSWDVFNNGSLLKHYSDGTISNPNVTPTEKQTVVEVTSVSWQVQNLKIDSIKCRHDKSITFKY